MALSFANDIRPLFRDGDIACMKDIGLDLSNLSDVRSNSANIYDRLADRSMPDDRPWSSDQIAKFKEWMDDGMQE